MKSVIYCMGLLVALTVAVVAQDSADVAVSMSQDTSAKLGHTAASKVSGQLQGSLDVKNAKVGDQVMLKTTDAVKQNGKTVIGKGSMILGHVTDVRKKAKGNAESSIGVLFDRVQQGKNQMPINAVITSVFTARSSASMDTEQAGVFSSSSAQSSSQARSGGGGLLGGVTSTTGSVLGTATDTVGGVTNTVGSSVGTTANAAAGTMKGLTISNSTSASAQGGSTLSLTGRDLRLEKGTTFNLNVTTTTSASVR